MPDEEQKALRARNLRTALIVAGIAFALFVSIVIRVWTLR